MTGVGPRTSGLESDRSTNWATSTSQEQIDFNSYSWKLLLLTNISSPDSESKFRFCCKGYAWTTLKSWNTLNNFVQRFLHFKS